jgi:hypothetical protein
MMLHCHCRDCQRASGGASICVVVVPIKALKITRGQPRYYDTPSTAGGTIHRGFCADCGSPLLNKVGRAPRLIGIQAGSLDDPTLFRPQLQMWTCDAQPWDYMNPALPKFEQYPRLGPQWSAFMAKVSSYER